MRLGRDLSAVSWPHLNPGVWDSLLSTQTSSHVLLSCGHSLPPTPNRHTAPSGLAPTLCQDNQGHVWQNSSGWLVLGTGRAPSTPASTSLWFLAFLARGVSKETGSILTLSPQGQVIAPPHPCPGLLPASWVLWWSGRKQGGAHWTIQTAA